MSNESYLALVIQAEVALEALKTLEQSLVRTEDWGYYRVLDRINECKQALATIKE
jgi:hypothetical protein